MTSETPKASASSGRPVSTFFVARLVVNHAHPGSAPERKEPPIPTAILAARLGVTPATITRSWIPKGCPCEPRLLRGFQFYEQEVRAWLTSKGSAKAVKQVDVTEITDRVTMAFAKLEARRRRKGRSS